MVDVGAASGGSHLSRRYPGATRHPTPIFNRFNSDPEFAAFFHFVNRLRSVPGVAKIRYATTGDRVHLWVLTREEDLEANKQLFRIEREFVAGQEDASLAVHVMPLAEISEDDLPPAEQLHPAEG